jgi:hypothetical protein
MKQTLADFLEVFEDTNKTVVMAILLFISAFFRIKGYIDGQGFVDLVKTTTIAFFGTTSVVHFTSMVKDNLANKLEQIKKQVPPVKEGS